MEEITQIQPTPTPTATPNNDIHEGLFNRPTE
jgi:hypothetical protein